MRAFLRLDSTALSVSCSICKGRQPSQTGGRLSSKRRSIEMYWSHVVCFFVCLLVFSNKPAGQTKRLTNLQGRPSVQSGRVTARFGFFLTSINHFSIFIFALAALNDIFSRSKVKRVISTVAIWYRRHINGPMGQTS